MVSTLLGGVTGFENHIPGRAALIDLAVRIRLFLGDRVYTQVLIGKDGYLEYINDNNLNAYQNSHDLPKSFPVNVQKKLSIIDEYLQKKNITLILVVAPNKATIYPDLVPEEIQKVNENSLLDELLEITRQNGPDIMLDLRPALIDARKSREVYYRTDTHWNGYGAYIAYYEIMSHLAETNPILKPNENFLNNILTQPPGTHDLPNLIGSLSLKEGFSLIDISKEQLKNVVYDHEPNSSNIYSAMDQELPRLLIYRDSFGGQIVEPIATHFSLTASIHMSSVYNSDMKPVDMIDIYKPDVIIIEIVERSLSGFNLWLNRFGLDFN